MKLAADIIAVMSRTRFHRILWQELNRKFGDGISTVFVMTPGQTLLHSEYDVSNLSDWASYKTFELVDNALQCATMQLQRNRVENFYEVGAIVDSGKRT